jgi:Holliday junction DNA helicase RuvB
MNIRPSSLEDFIGQERVRQVLQILCRSAKAKGTAVSHVLLSGPPGLGKTTLARIVANEMGSRLVETIGGNLQAPEQLVGLLRSLKPLDVLFIDEIHAMPRSVEEILYPAMEDGTVSVVKTDSSDFMRALGVQAKPATEMVALPPFTLLGASTMSGLVSSPLRSRFAHELILEPYSHDDLTRIVLRASGALGYELNPGVAMEVARRSRSTARIAVGHLRWLIEYSSGLGVVPDINAVQDAFCMRDVDACGLTGQDRRYLSMLIQAGQPLGLASVSAALNETVETIEQAMEPHLIREGLLRRAPRGRVATERAREMFATPQEVGS